MSWTLDIIIILIVSLTVYFAAKNGFVKTAISASSFIIAIVLTAILTTPVAEAIKASPLAATVRNATEDRIEGILLEGSYEISSLIEGESEEFNKLLSVARIDKDDLLEKYVSMDPDKVAYNLAVEISNPIIDTVAIIVAIIIIYIGTQIILSIVSFILDKVCRLPVLKSCNKLLGIVVGVVLALLRACLFCFVIKILMENADFLGSSFIAGLAPEKTLLFKTFSEIDIFSFFI
jgi:uncharacterized membrane protein required for colicin V production